MTFAQLYCKPCEKVTKHEKFDLTTYDCTICGTSKTIGDVYPAKQRKAEKMWCEACRKEQTHNVTVNDTHCDVCGEEKN